MENDDEEEHILKQYLNAKQQISTSSISINANGILPSNGLIHYHINTNRISTTTLQFDMPQKKIFFIYRKTDSPFNTITEGGHVYYSIGDPFGRVFLDWNIHKIIRDSVPYESKDVKVFCEVYDSDIVDVGYHTTISRAKNIVLQYDGKTVKLF